MIGGTDIFLEPHRNKLRKVLPDYYTPSAGYGSATGTHPSRWRRGLRSPRRALCLAYGGRAVEGGCRWAQQLLGDLPMNPFPSPPHYAFSLAEARDLGKRLEAAGFGIYHEQENP